MFVSNLVMYFVILATALTSNAGGKTDISTGAEAAQALRPLAGDLAGLIFAAGMIGTGLLAVPVLSGASAYAVSETFAGARASTKTGGAPDPSMGSSPSPR
jgi:Mn2+/Fe2+ NRAMP family transporter